MESECEKDTKLSVDSPTTSDVYEKLLQSEFNGRHSVTVIRYPLSARTIVFPATSSRVGASEFLVTMTDKTNSDKDVLYKLIIAAYNYVFHDKSAANTAKNLFSRATPRFIDWLNKVELTNRFEVLKEYEAYHFDRLNNHGGASVLHQIKTIFTYALDKTSELHENLTACELSYLLDLKKTKISPNLNKAQKSLASYFGLMDWLRRDDVGIGNELYTALVSPKLTINSLILTASTTIIQLDMYKHELHCFFNDNGFDESIFMLPNKLSHTKKREFIGSVLYQVISAYHAIKKSNVILKNALEVVLLSNVPNVKSFQILKSCLDSQQQCDAIFKNNLRDIKKISVTFCASTFSQIASGNLFSLKVLQQLTQPQYYASSTAIEELMFSWLMASLTVQPYDIPKLTVDSFRLLKVGGKVRYIECEYFKSRAKVFHTTRSLSSRSLEGQALIIYLSNVKKGKTLCGKKGLIISNGINSISGALSCLLTTDGMQASLLKQHQKKDHLPLIIPKVLVSLIQHGIHSLNIVPEKGKELLIEGKDSLVQHSATSCSQTLFGLQAIKNSAVHAYSDPYTLHYLINRNSHSNHTEKENYLNSDNEEWMNSAGRITREVMLDLINNVYDLGFESFCDKEKQKGVDQFNCEFTTVTESMSYKTGEMLARLKIVTDQTKGKINEVGVLAFSDKNESQLFSPLNVIDSPVTAWKMNNYLHEFKKNYRKLLSSNPEYLYKTVMPTVEWIEHTLNKLSKDSQKSGLLLFNNILKSGVVVSVFHSI